MKIKDKEFKTFVSEAELDAIVQRLAGEISRDCTGADLVACPVLTGA
jgi:hypoxanthine-guanine phosphoribosyltransferase